MVRGSLPQTMVRDRFHDFIMTPVLLYMNPYWWHFEQIMNFQTYPMATCSNTPSSGHRPPPRIQRNGSIRQD